MTSSEEDVDNLRSVTEHLDTIVETGCGAFKDTRPIPFQIATIRDFGMATAFINRCADNNFQEANYGKALRSYTRLVKLLEIWLAATPQQMMIKPTQAEVEQFLSSAYFNRANTYDELGKYDEALADYSCSLQLRNPEPWSVLLNRALVHEKLHQFDRAQQDLIDAQKIVPNSADALVIAQRLNLVLSRIGSMEARNERWLRAVYEADLRMIRALVWEGIDVNACVAGKTALIVAASNGDTEIGKLLIEAGADINAQVINAGSALMQASSGGYTPFVRMLLAAGADVNAPSTGDITSLMACSEQGHAETVKLLLNAGADVNARTTNGFSALYWAALRGHPDVVETLLRAGARTDIGWLPLVIALITGNLRLAQLLLHARRAQW